MEIELLRSNIFARLIVAYDGTAPADAALGCALRLAQLYDGDVIAVNVCDDPPSSVVHVPSGSREIAPDPEPVLRSVPGEQRRLFEQLCERVAASCVSVRLEFMVDETAAGILDAAARWRASAIAVGSRGRRCDRARRRRRRPARRRGTRDDRACGRHDR